MRPIGTATLLLALAAAAVLTGCGSGGGDADDVPTITTRPSISGAGATETTGSATSPTTRATTSPTDATTSTTGDAPPTETAGPSPEPPTDRPTGPTTYRKASALIDEAGRPIAQPLRRFSTDEDLLYCLLDDPVIGPACELSRGFVKDEEVCGGSAEGVGRIETFEGEARPVCNTDTIREPGAQQVLGDGVVSDGKDVRCLVDRYSVTCIDLAAETGFFLAPREYHVF